MVKQVLVRAATAQFALLQIPLFEHCKYERAIEAVKGKILFRAPPGTWSFVPDGYWVGECNSQGEGRYLPHHTMAVVAIGRGVLDRSENERMVSLTRVVTAWWAARAPAEWTTRYLASQ